jgi:hypothetical protein
LRQRGKGTAFGQLGLDRLNGAVARTDEQPVDALLGKPAQDGGKFVEPLHDRNVDLRRSGEALRPAPGRGRCGGPNAG